jgi:carboxypeptidase family protein/TonB-dependent receptor-like protein
MSESASRTSVQVWSNLRKLSLAVAAIVASLLVSSPLMAQLNTGRISGQITDQTGGAIAGASVTVIDVARGQNRALASDASGDYAAPNLTPGIYTVRAAFMGFQTVERQNVEVTVGGDVRVDLTLQPGAQTQTVTVTESIPVVNTTNAQTGGVLENQLMTDLPTVGRNFRYQQSFVPGVQVGLGTTGTVQVDVNGTTDNHGGNSMLDGLYDQTQFTAESTFGGSGEAGFTTILPLDAVQEMNLVTNPKAEYGWIPGVTASVGLKSGTNDMHGDAYAFGHDTDLAARNAFAPARTPIDFEQFGATIGGPIKKNKLFYFAGYEGFRESASSIVGNITAPSSAAGGGTQSSIPDAIAAINAAGHNNLLSQLSLNIAGCNASTLLGNASLTTGAAVAPFCTANQFGAPSLWSNPNLGDVPDAGSSDNGLLKVDYHINDHHSLNASFAYGAYFELAAANSAQKITQNYWEEVLGVPSNNEERVVEIWTPNSNWLNEARWGRDVNNRPVGRAECSPNGDLSNPTGLGAGTGGYGGPNYLMQYGLDSGALGCGIPTITLSGGGTPLNAQLGFSNARSDYEVDEQGADSVSYTRGSHQFKFGVDIRAISFNGSKVLDSLSGVIDFNASTVKAFSGASALEDFLTGTPATETIAAGSNQRSLSTNQVAVFAQDDWRIKPRLTLNLGIREEIVTPPTSNTDNLGNFDPTSPTGIVAVTQPFKNHYNFEPRFGFAWDVTGKGTTTIRGGIGVLNGLATIMNFVSGGPGNYDTVPTGETIVKPDGTTLQAPGNGRSGTIAPLPGTIVWPKTNSGNTALFPASLFSTPSCGNGLASTSNPAIINPVPCAMAGGDPNFQYYHYIFWNVNFEHAITNTLSVDIGYVASRSTGIFQQVNYNLAPPTSDTTLANPASEQTRAPYFGQFPWFSSINLFGDNQMNWYRSLQISVTKRVSHGLTVNAAYTYSGNYLTEGVLNPNVPVQGLDGPYSDNLYPAHNLSVAATYAVHGIKTPGQILEGWELNTSVTLISALPFAVLDTKDDFAGAGTGSAIGAGGIPWTLYGPAGPINQIFGRAGSIPCYGVAAGPTGSGIKAGSFAKSPCTSVLAGSSATPWSNMPAACIQAAQSEASFAPGLTQGQPGTGLAQLAAVGCYMVNGSAIVPPAEGTYGTMLPDAIDGPGRSLVDASVTKLWKFKERYSVQFRAEAFNLFNRTQYLGQGTDPSNPSKFGLAQFTPDVRAGDPIQGRGGPRYFQFGLKLLF